MGSFLLQRRLHGERITHYTCIEAWKCLNVTDSPLVGLNPLGNLLYNRAASQPPTRAAKSGCLLPPTKRKVQSFPWWAYTCWNKSPSLRSATTLSAAKRAATALAASAPLQ